MKSLLIFCALLVLSVPAPIQAAPPEAPEGEYWDRYDVIDGPDPTLRYGFFTQTNRTLCMGRYYFIDDGTRLQVRLAPFGRTPIELPVHRYDRQGGVLELGWEGRPERRCVLRHPGENLWLGSCLEGEAVMPMAIRVADESDVEWQGAYFPVSSTDVAIVYRAWEIMAGQGPRNRADERICDDDIASGRHSVFCALFAASLEAAGVYRHRRPAMQVVRDTLWERFPGEYVHTLRDINNNADISDAQIIAALSAAQATLAGHIGRSWD